MALLLTLTDKRDNTGVTASIAGSSSSAANAIYVQRIDETWDAAAAWTLAGSRSGDGTVNLPLAPGRYWGQAHSVVGGQTTVSLVRWGAATSGETALLVQILDAVQAKIRTLGLEGITASSVVVRQLNLDAGLGVGEAIPYPACLLAPGKAETADSSSGVNGADDYGLPVAVTLLAAAPHTSERLAVEQKMLLWRETLMTAFQNQRLPGVPQSAMCRVEPGPIADGNAWAGGRHRSEMTLRFFVRLRRRS